MENSVESITNETASKVKKSFDMPKLSFDENKIKRRILFNQTIRYVFLAATLSSLFVLMMLIYRILSDGISFLDWHFLTNNLSRNADRAGIIGALIGSVGLMLVVIPVTIVLGVATAIYLEEYAGNSRIAQIIKTNISNLASVPSVVFGLLGLAVFARFLGMGPSILAGGLTMSLLVLPIVVVASQEAIRAVPYFLKEASYGLGANKWTTIWKVVLPTALPGILSGSILAVSRALGETAPLVVIGIPTFLLKLPNSLTDTFTALPIQIYYWTLNSVLTEEYANLAAATIIVLMTVLFILNSVAIIIRNKYQKSY